MDIREAIGAVIGGRDLTEEQARAVFTQIMEGEATPGQIGAFLTALRLKGETVEEITGAARVMREKATHISTEGIERAIVDTCGTGGDASGTFNVSTAAAFVVAGAGGPVAKQIGRAACTARG